MVSLICFLSNWFINPRCQSPWWFIKHKCRITYKNANWHESWCCLLTMKREGMLLWMSHEMFAQPVIIMLWLNSVQFLDQPFPLYCHKTQVSVLINRFCQCMLFFFDSWSAIFCCPTFYETAFESVNWRQILFFFF